MAWPLSIVEQVPLSVKCTGLPPAFLPFHTAQSVKAWAKLLDEEKEPELEDEDESQEEFSP